MRIYITTHGVFLSKQNPKFFFSIHQSIHQSINHLNNSSFHHSSPSLYKKNRFLFFTNLLLLERSSGQRIIFVRETINSPRIKPVKVGCSILLRNEYLFNFLKMIVSYSFPKLCELIKRKNSKLSKQNLIFLNINYFLFFSSFSFSNDFDKFLSFYEDFNYYLSIELYSGFYKFLINKPLFSSYGLTFL